MASKKKIEFQFLLFHCCTLLGVEFTVRYLCDGNQMCIVSLRECFIGCIVHCQREILEQAMILLNYTTIGFLSFMLHAPTTCTNIHPSIFFFKDDNSVVSIVQLDNNMVCITFDGYKDVCVAHH